MVRQPKGDQMRNLIENRLDFEPEATQTNLQLKRRKRNWKQE